jgi:YD repeat-containing protein
MISSIPLANWSLNDATRYKIDIDGYAFDNQSARQLWSIQALDSDSVRFELRDGDRHWWDVANGHTVERAELAENLQPIADGTAMQISYGLLIEPGASNTAWWTVIGQLHQDLNASGTGSPPFAIELVGERMQIEVRWGSSADVHTTKLFVDVADIVRGHLYDMKITAIFDPTGNGRLVVERDGVMLADYSGPLGLAEQTGVYWAEGIYRSDNASEALAVQYRDLDIRTGSDVVFPDKDAFIAAPVVRVAHVDPGTGAAASVSLSGTAAAGSTVSIFDNGKAVATVGVDASGQFQAVLGLNGAGAHALTSFAVNAAGHQGITSSAQTVLFASSAGIVAQLGSLSADPSIAAIVLTDTHVLRVTTTREASYAQHKDVGVLAKIAGDYTLVLSQTVTGKSYDRQDITYSSDGKMDEVTRWSGTKLVYDQIFANNGSQTVRTWSATGSSDRSAISASGQRLSYESYNASGQLIFHQDFGSDGSVVTHYFNVSTGLETSFSQVAADKSRIDTTVNIQGKDYTTQVTTFDALGKITVQERLTANDIKVFSQTWSSDGSRVIHNYSATTGRETSSSLVRVDGSHVETTFGITGKSYAVQALFYEAQNRASGQELYSATGKLIAQEVWNADGSKKISVLDSVTGATVGYTLVSTDKSHTDVTFKAPGSQQILQSVTYDAAGRVVSKQTFDAAGHLATSEIWAADGTHVTKTYKDTVMVRTQVYDGQGLITADTAAAVMTPPSAPQAPAPSSSSTPPVADKVVAANGSWTEMKTGIIGKGYTSELKSYDAAGQPTATARWSGDTLVMRDLRNSDGSRETHTYDAGTGVEIKYTVFDADQSRVDVTYGITGKGYTSQTIAYDAGGKATETDRFQGSKLVFSTRTEPDGTQVVKSWTATGELTLNRLANSGALTSSDRFNSDGTRVYAEMRNSDGSREIHTYDAGTGAETGYTVFNADKSRVEVNLAVTGKAYATQHVTYDATGKLVEMVRHYDSANKVLAFSSSTHADGSSETYSYDMAGRETSRNLTNSDHVLDVVTSSYAGTSPEASTVRQDHFSSAGQKLWTDVTASDGSHAITALATGQTLTAHVGVTDVFTSFGSDTFVFTIGFGKDVIKGFHAETGPLHDMIQISHDLASNFDHLTMRDVGKDVVLNFDAHTTLTLTNVHAAQLDAHDFLFA